MAEIKKNGETQAVPSNTTVSPTTTANAKKKEPKKTCPALYPSKPYVSNK